jgi:hypothetical protein
MNLSLYAQNMKIMKFKSLESFNSEALDDVEVFQWLCELAKNSLQTTKMFKWMNVIRGERVMLTGVIARIFVVFKASFAIFLLFSPE